MHGVAAGRRADRGRLPVHRPYRRSGAGRPVREVVSQDAMTRGLPRLDGKGDALWAGLAAAVR